MIIDGVDFWYENRHFMKMWDKVDESDIISIRIDEKIRVGQPFSIFFETDQYPLFKILQKQYKPNYKSNLLIIVEDTKTKKETYKISFRISLKEVIIAEFIDVEMIRFQIIYNCESAEDETDYKKYEELREI